MTDRFGEICDMYRASFEEHGDSPASLLTPKGRQDVRYRVLDPFVLRPGITLLDYGCGLGHLLEHLQKQDRQVNYTGMDMLPDFVRQCRAKYGTQAHFELIDPSQPLTQYHDIVFASGVFNICSHGDAHQSRKYALERITQLFDVVREVLVCDFLSSLVDFRQPGAQHFTAGEIAEFCGSRLTRRFQIRHDLLPYEFTLIAWRDDAIRHPHSRYLHEPLGCV